MMKSLTLLMHREARPLLGLADILSAVPDNGWDWCVHDFDGIGSVPEGIPEFGRRARATGVPFSWAELKDFAHGLEQTIDCLIVAQDAAGRVIAVEADDSTEWRVDVRSDVVEADAILTSLNGLR